MMDEHSIDFDVRHNPAALELCDEMEAELGPVLAALGVPADEARVMIEAEAQRQYLAGMVETLAKLAAKDGKPVWSDSEVKAMCAALRSGPLPGLLRRPQAVRRPQGRPTVARRQRSTRRRVRVSRAGPDDPSGEPPPASSLPRLLADVAPSGIGSVVA